MLNDDSRDLSIERQIDAYVKGRLSEDEVQALWVELLKKPEYISLLQTEVDLTRVYQAGQNRVSDRNYYYWWAAAAAVVVALVIAINFFSIDAQQNIQAYTQQKIDITNNLSTAQVTRSGDETVAASDSMLNAGFKAAVDGRHAEAIQIYKRVLARFEDPGIRSKSYLNLGILEYNGESYKQSIVDFKHALEASDRHELLKERAYWYLGNAYVNTDQLEKARDAVQKAYSLGKLYKNEAFKLLKRLDYRLGNIDFDNFEKQIQAPPSQ